MRICIDEPIAAGVDDAEAPSGPRFLRRPWRAGRYLGPRSPLAYGRPGKGRSGSWWATRFSGQLNGAARRILDPAKLTWSQETDVDLASRRSEVRMVPDNYAGLLSFSGWYELDGLDKGHCNQHFEADLRIHVPVLGPGRAGPRRQHPGEPGRHGSPPRTDPRLSRAAAGRRSQPPPRPSDPLAPVTATPLPPTTATTLASHLAAWPGVAAAGLVTTEGEVAVAGAVEQPFPWVFGDQAAGLHDHAGRRERGTVALEDAAGPPGSSLAHLLAHASGLPFEGQERPWHPPGGAGLTPTPVWNRPPPSSRAAPGRVFREYLGSSGNPADSGMRHTVVEGLPAHGGSGPLGDLLLLARELWRPPS